MKAFAVVSCLFAINTIFAVSEQQKMHFSADETGSLVQHYLALCAQENIQNRSVYLRSDAREKQPFFTDITFLDLNLSSVANIHEVMTEIFYGEVDVIHLTNVSTEQALYLFELLEPNYAHFIYVPKEEQGSIIASKYPLSQAAVTKDVQQEVLDFFIHGANTHHARIYSDNSSIQIINSEETNNKITSCIALANLIGTLTVLSQQYSPLKATYATELLASETFQVLPIRNRDRGGSDQDSGGV